MAEITQGGRRQKNFTDGCDSLKNFGKISGLCDFFRSNRVDHWIATVEWQKLAEKGRN
jgi:hypothetical protein